MAHTKPTEAVSTASPSMVTAMPALTALHSMVTAMPAGLPKPTVTPGQFIDTSRSQSGGKQTITPTCMPVAQVNSNTALPATSHQSMAIFLTRLMGPPQPEMPLTQAFGGRKAAGHPKTG
ncbi:hypothetical protein H2248_002999 [Termitomyces sp. 'cryptogamus']|nr:hypothetical protein H2248_002999 [Termitomyces sp. 'cryptogamus']